MRSRLSDHFRQQRNEHGLSLAELARMVGYRNLSKGCNKIAKFEQRGEIHADLLRKLADSLGIDPTTIDEFIKQDRREFDREWNQWADVPIIPHIVIRLIAAVHLSKKLPEFAKTLDEAEIIAADAARERKMKVCLIWSRRLSVWFDSDGNVESRTETVPGETNIPHMRMKGSQRSFLLENPETGQVILRLIHWPKQPISTQLVSSTTNEQE